MGKYSISNNTQAVSTRLAPGLKDRITFECQQRSGWNRNKFINYACMAALDLCHEVRCGNVRREDLPPSFQRYAYVFGL